MNKTFTRRAALISLAGVALAQPSASDLDRVKAGDAALAFTLPSAAGGNVSLASLRGKNVVLVFYRGHW